MTYLYEMEYVRLRNKIQEWLYVLYDYPYPYATKTTTRAAIDRMIKEMENEVDIG